MRSMDSGNELLEHFPSDDCHPLAIRARHVSLAMRPFPAGWGSRASHESHETALGNSLENHLELQRSVRQAGILVRLHELEAVIDHAQQVRIGDHVRPEHGWGTAQPRQRRCELRAGSARACRRRSRSRAESAVETFRSSAGHAPCSGARASPIARCMSSVGRRRTERKRPPEKLGLGRLGRGALHSRALADPAWIPADDVEALAQPAVDAWVKAIEPVNLLIIRAWMQEGSARPLRVEARLTGDVGHGFEREMAFSESEPVETLVAAWLAEVQAG
jgi:hypothetical protein